MSTSGWQAANECGWKRGDKGAVVSQRDQSRTGRMHANGEYSETSERSRAAGAHEALPHTPPGGLPPETPAPFPSGSMFQNGSHRSRVHKSRHRAPLTDGFRSEETTEMRERGPSARSSGIARRGEDGALCAHEALPHAPPGGLPPETPGFSA